jgi:two-component system nitrate/nitrite response regulator NarL
MPPFDIDLRIIVVAEDHLVRAGLAAILTEQPECSVVGQVSGAEYAAMKSGVFGADVAVWDLGWEPESAIELVTGVSESTPPIVAIVPDDSYAEDAWVAGASGVLFREADTDTLVGTLIAVARGLIVHDPALGRTGSLPESVERSSGDPIDLTPRERQVLDLVAEGLPNKAIASRLDISEHTVKFHINSILNKLGAQSRTEAVTLATRSGLITL